MDQLRETPVIRAVQSLALVVLALPGVVSAHSFGRLYNLPVPFWLYAYGAAAALLLSFLLIAWLANADAPARPASAREYASRWLQNLRHRGLLAVLKVISVAGLLLCVLTGLFGNRNPYVNFNMTFFWVVFVLGFSYLTALIGDLYAAINPWQNLAQLLDRVIAGFTRGRVRYPAGLAYWPALAFYMGFIWIELFAYTRPFSLAVWLLAYTLINLAGVWLVGISAWFRYCEFFAVLLRLIARMAPLHYTPVTVDQPARLRLRAPLVGLLEDRAEHISLVLFVLFMLSSTAFDGLRVTVPWYNLFWLDPFNIVSPWVGETQPVYAYATLRPFYLAYETVCLLISPFIYLAVYLLFIGAAKFITRSPRPLKELALCFALSLLPIALAYNVTHYYTLILTQGVTILSLLSDPFGWGWNLFGTAGKFRAPILPGMGFVWHSQVGLILFGHIVSVYLAHREALALFPSRRLAVLSQLPMLLLMMIFTTVGLWILAQPIQGS